MDEQFISQLREKMRKVLSLVREDFQTVRTGRANPQLIENIQINVYQGSQRLKLKELATITTGEVRTLVISPFDISIINEIVKGLQGANLGYNPFTEGELIRINIPPLTDERRQEYLRLVKTKAEGGKIMMRQVRQEAMSLLKKQLEREEIDEDQKKRLEKRVQETTDEMIVEIERMLKNKEEEIKQI